MATAMRQLQAGSGVAAAASSKQPHQHVAAAPVRVATVRRRAALQPAQAVPLGRACAAQLPRQLLQQQQQSAGRHPRRQQQQRLQHERQRQQRVLLFAVAPDAPEAAGGDEEGAASSALDPSIPAVDQDFDLLGAEVKRLTEVLTEELKGCSIYLVGMMGSGKSTTGKMLANTLKYTFFDTDTIVERAHPDESVSDIFSKYGEDYFRQCEEQVLKELAPYKNLVVATGGGAVLRPKNWSYMHNGIVAWLQGEPGLLARRVVAEGIEKRPLLFGEGVSGDEAYDISLGKLTSLLEARARFYGNADVSVDLRGYGKDEATGAPTAVVMFRLMEAIQAKIQATKEEREARRQFTIKRGGVVPSLKTQASPAAAPQQQQQQQQQQAEE